MCVHVCLVRLELFLKFFLLCLSCPPVLSLVGVEVHPGTGIQSASVSDDGRKVTVTTDNGGEVRTYIRSLYNTPFNNSLE